MKMRLLKGWNEFCRVPHAARYHQRPLFALKAHHAMLESVKSIARSERRQVVRSVREDFGGSDIYRRNRCFDQNRKRLYAMPIFSQLYIAVIVLNAGALREITCSSSVSSCFSESSRCSLNEEQASPIKGVSVRWQFRSWLFLLARRKLCLLQGIVKYHCRVDHVLDAVSKSVVTLL